VAGSVQRFQSSSYCSAVQCSAVECNEVQWSLKVLQLSATDAGVIPVMMSTRAAVSVCSCCNAASKSPAMTLVRELRVSGLFKCMILQQQPVLWFEIR
jgi:hypothetical protein